MPESTFTVSIDRTSLDKDPLVMSGHGNTLLAVIGYQEPPMVPQLALAPESELIHGDVTLGWKFQSVILPLKVATLEASSETESRAAIAELVEAITQFPARYPVTITVNDAPPETWACDPGSLTPDGERDSTNLEEYDQVWSLNIPAYPIRSV